MDVVELFDSVERRDGGPLTLADIEAAVAMLTANAVPREGFLVPMVGAEVNPECPACREGRYRLHRPDEARRFHA